MQNPWWTLALCIICGCQRSVMPAAKTATALAHCTVFAGEDGHIACAYGEISLRALGLASPLRAALQRASGGLWLLDGTGTLARIDRNGELTFASASKLVSLLALDEVVCGIEPDGVVRCFTDHHEDLLCGERAPAPTALSWALDFRAFAPGGADQLCGTDLHGKSTCYRLIRQCERACLRFPGCDAPRRCADPCRPNERPIELVHPAPAEGAALFVHQLRSSGDKWP